VPEAKDSRQEYLKEECATQRNIMTTKAPRTGKTKAVEAVATPEKDAEAMPEKAPGVFEVFIDHQRKALSEAEKALESLLPEGFREHAESAIKEVIEGYRRLFNAGIDQIISAVQRAKASTEENTEQIVKTLEQAKISAEEEAEKSK
jgi:hypothetical protein